jgi:putative transposase
MAAQVSSAFVGSASCWGSHAGTYYYEPATESAENLALMRAIDEQYLKRPTFGSRLMTQWLRRQRHAINRKRVQRLMRIMGLEAIYPRKNTSKPGVGHKIYPYLLRGVAVTRPNQVWCTDITYIPMACGFMYLVAVMDWHSRHVLAWRLSNSMDTEFCLEALDEALMHGKPEIFNSDQGAQFTSDVFTGRLLSHGISISMDGRGRFHRAILADFEIRRNLPQGVCDCGRSISWADRLPCLLRDRTAPSRTR